MHLDNVGPKIAGIPQNNFWAIAFLHQISELPQLVNMNQWEIGGALKTRSKNVGAPAHTSPKKKHLWEAKIQTFMQNFSALGQITLGPFGITSSNVST